MKTITVSNFKGGVGKTTIAASVAVDLAVRLNKKVLLVDFDPQCNLTGSFFNDTYSELDTYMQFLLKEKELKVHNITSNLDILVGGMMLERFSNTITNDQNHRLNPGGQLKKTLKNYENIYDYCIIDSRPSIDLTVSNALVASDYVLIPVQPTVRSIDGLSMTIELISSIKENINPNLVLLGFVINEYNEKNISANYINSTMKEYSGAILNTKIRKAEAVVFAENNNIDIFQQRKNDFIKTDFKNLTDEILLKIK